MKKLFYPFFLITIVIGLISCNNEDDEKIMLQDITAMTNPEPAQRFIFMDGNRVDDAYAKAVTFKVLDTISKDNDKIYEAEMEMQLPEMRRISLDDMTFSRMTFHINAKASEERITFSGDEIHSLGETKYTVEGYMKQGLSYEQDTLLVQVKRISPKASFAGNTYELTFDENTFGYSDFSDNGNIDNRPVIEYAQEAVPYYANYQRDKTNGAIYRLTFQEDGTLGIKKKDHSMTDFESVTENFRYYITSSNSNKGTGMIEMSFDTAMDLECFLQGGLLEGTNYYYSYPPQLPIYTFNLPFEYVENEKGELMIALGDKITPQYKIRNSIKTWMYYHADGYYTPGETDPLKVFLDNWSIPANDLLDNLWWNLKRI